MIESSRAEEGGGIFHFLFSSDVEGTFSDQISVWICGFVVGCCRDLVGYHGGPCPETRIQSMVLPMRRYTSQLLFYPRTILRKKGTYHTYRINTTSETLI
jgi:hypothetical protein